MGQNQPLWNNMTHFVMITQLATYAMSLRAKRSNLVLTIADQEISRRDCFALPAMTCLFSKTSVQKRHGRQSDFVCKGISILWHDCCKINLRNQVFQKNLVSYFSIELKAQHNTLVVSEKHDLVEGEPLCFREN